MAVKKKQRSKSAHVSRADPWLKWYDPVQSTDKQSQIEIKRFLDDSECPMDDIELSDAISSAAKNIVPEVPDIKRHPVPELESLRVGYSLGIMSMYGDTQEFTMYELSERIFQTLSMIRNVWPWPKAVDRLKDLSKDLVQLLHAAHELMQKKIALANTMHLTGTMAKLKQADEALCMVELTGDIDKDAEQLFLVRKITAEEFRPAMLRAFKLDRETTAEINTWEETSVPLQTGTTGKRKRYPQDKEALKLLAEAKRRYESKTYADSKCSHAEVIRQMMDEHSNYEARILRGKLKGKKGGREHTTSLDRGKAIQTWGKHLSAYILVTKKA